MATQTFDKGDRVLTPGGPGVVVYKRMAPPDYATVDVYSIYLDARLNDARPYSGTIYRAGDVSAEPPTSARPLVPFDGWTLERLEERAHLNRLRGIAVSDALRQEIARRRRALHQALREERHERDPYELPDGRIVNIPADVARGAATITFELERGADGARRIVDATLVVQRCEFCGEPAGEGGAICPACVANHKVRL